MGGFEEMRLILWLALGSGLGSSFRPEQIWGRWGSWALWICRLHSQHMRAYVIGRWCSSGSCRSYWTGLWKRKWKRWVGSWLRCGWWTVVVTMESWSRVGCFGPCWGESGTAALVTNTPYINFIINTLINIYKEQYSLWTTYRSPFSCRDKAAGRAELEQRMFYCERTHCYKYCSSLCSRKTCGFLVKSGF